MFQTIRLIFGCRIIDFRKDSEQNVFNLTSINLLFVVEEEISFRCCCLTVVKSSRTSFVKKSLFLAFTVFLSFFFTPFLIKVLSSF